TAALRSIDGASKAHDVLCVGTADPGNPSFIGSMVVPTAFSFSTNSAASQGGTGGLIESLNPTGGIIVITNNGGTTAHNAINFRHCAGPGVGVGCGTDFQIVEDPASTNKQ